MSRQVSLDSRIDDLYRGPLHEFIAARSALAADLKGPDQKRVKQLKKPTVVPWAVNQVYWHARGTFDRAVRSGHELRRTQVSALEGRPADVRAATEAHRTAVAAAVTEAVQLLDSARLRADREALARTFEALTLAATPGGPAGRLTEPLQPGGFEMLAGVVPAPGAAKPPTAKARAAETAARERARQEAAAAGRRADAMKKAEAAVARAREREARASEDWERAREELDRARQALAKLQSST